jgi:hypothetical protein
MVTTRRILIAIALVSTAVVALPTAPAASASAIQIVKIEYNPPGPDDRSNGHRNQEYVAIRNTGTTRRDLSGWTLRDAAGHKFTFPQGFRLGAGNLVRVRTGHGTNTGMSLYWNSGNYIWNNTGDTATLKSALPTTADTCNYTDSNATKEYKLC